MFSEHALISPYRDICALMFRFVSYKDNHVLTDVEVKVTIGLQLTALERKNGIQILSAARFMNANVWTACR